MSDAGEMDEPIPKRRKQSQNPSNATITGYGDDRSWIVPIGTTVADALLLISEGKADEAKKLVLEAVVDGDDGGRPVVLPLPPLFRIETRWHYRVKKEVEELLPRRFAAGHAVNPTEFYYVEPRGLNSLVEDLRNGKYCILCDRRQSGKTTMVLAVSEQLKKKGDVVPVYVGGMGSAKSIQHADAMWAKLCTYLHLACPALFRKPQPGEGGDDLFLSYFYKMNLSSTVTLLFDEADSLLNLPPDCLDELFHTIRNVKADSHLYNLRGFLLVGVETVKDLLEAQYSRRKVAAAVANIEYIPGSTPSRLSPFPHDHTLPSTRFDTADIINLIEQANVDVLGAIADVQEIATSIWQWTGGHKGLVGTCLTLMMREEAFCYGAWLKLFDSYKPARYIFGQATYSRMMRYFKTSARSDYDTLAGFLEFEELKHQSVVHLRDLLAEGVLIAEEDGMEYTVKLSSPLLRMAILYHCTLVGQEVDKPPGSPFAVDRCWTICETIRMLDGNAICRSECANASGSPSEYSLQFSFMCRLKAVLHCAYPSVRAVVLPEVREVMKEGSRRSRLRLDSLVRDSDRFPRFGFEFLVEGSKADLRNHYDRAVLYSRQHLAQVYLMNFAMDKDPEQICPEDDSVFFWAVQFDQGDQSVKVRTLDSAGACEEFKLQLKCWTGKFCFDHLV